MKFSKTTDYALVRDILTDPQVYKKMANDAAPPPDYFEVGPIDGIDFILAEYEGIPAGIFLLNQDGECHVCIRPDFWGRAEWITSEFLAWVWKKYEFQRITGAIPGYNRLAIRLARRVGFIECGHIPNSVQKYGKDYDQILFAALRP